MWVSVDKTIIWVELSARVLNNKSVMCFSAERPSAEPHSGGPELNGKILFY